MSDQHHLANRSKTDLSKKVEHNAPSAQRSLKSATNAADRLASSIGNAATSSVESLTSAAANDHGASTARALASSASVGGRVVKTTLKTSVNIVAKVPETVRRAPGNKSVLARNAIFSPPNDTSPEIQTEVYRIRNRRRSADRFGACRQSVLRAAQSSRIGRRHGILGNGACVAERASSGSGRESYKNGNSRRGAGAKDNPEDRHKS